MTAQHAPPALAVHSSLLPPVNAASRNSQLTSAGTVSIRNQNARSVKTMFVALEKKFFLVQA